jgi:RHS repeat-associated protein
VTTKLAYDGLDRLAEYNGSGTIQRRYAPGDTLGAPVVWYEGSGTTDRRFQSTDERGSVIAVSDASGNLLAANSYDEYGNPGASNLGAFGYTGQAWLPTVKLWYYKARELNPELGRFLQPDPIGYSGGANLYAYVLNDPVNLIDPLGREPDDGSICPKDDPNCGIVVTGNLLLPALYVFSRVRWIELGVGGVTGLDLPTLTVCPAVTARITGVGPNQANSSNPTSISQTPGNQIELGSVAIDPLDFGVPNARGAARGVLSQVLIVPFWPLAQRPSNGAPSVPRGLPSWGPYSVVDVIGPASARNQPGFNIDLYRYSNQDNALASTRNVPVSVIIPKNDAGVSCPTGK